VTIGLAILTRLFLSHAALAAGAEPVSYSRQVAPIVALRCNACHGANPHSLAGGLSTRTWSELSRIVVPGDPHASRLVQFVELGRMPPGAPLPGAEIEIIRRWVREGARVDRDDTPRRVLELAAVRFHSRKPARIAARVPVMAYVEIEVLDARGRLLHRDGEAVRSPGEWIVWELRRAPGWPPRARVRLTVSHAAGDASRAELTLGNR
jgi:hypothetical protein